MTEHTLKCFFADAKFLGFSGI